MTLSKLSSALRNSKVNRWENRLSKRMSMSIWDRSSRRTSLQIFLVELIDPRIGNNSIIKMRVSQLTQKMIGFKIWEAKVESTRKFERNQRALLLWSIWHQVENHLMWSLSALKKTRLSSQSLLLQLISKSLLLQKRPRNHHLQWILG